MTADCLNLTDSKRGLEVRGLTAAWNRSPVLEGVDLDIRPGEIVAVLGSNGSGKSSLLWTIAGLLRRRSGIVAVDGARIDGLSADRIARLGVGVLTQTRRVFPTLSVRQNLEVSDLAPRSLRGLRREGEERANADRRQQWLERFPALRAKLDEPAARLSGGEQQMLAICRVFSTSPRLLLLDEPSAGLSAALTARCAGLLQEVAEHGTAIALVEQNIDLARRLATRSFHMRLGRLHADV